MLRSLQIRNYALIDSLDVDFPEGLVIITGQTGAGKSILLGALSLLLGTKADAGVIGSGGENCVVEAVFKVPEDDPSLKEILETNEIDSGTDELIARRVVARSGRSRSFINDSPVSVQVLQGVTSRLVDIHSQHQNLMLSDHAFQLRVLDGFAGNKALLDKCASGYRSLIALENEYSAIREKLSRMEEEREYVEARWKRLDEARLREGELEELESEQGLLANAEVVKENLTRVEDALSSFDLKEVRKALERAGKYLPDANILAERVESSRAELRDILEEVSLINSRTELSQSRLQAVEERMSQLYDLMKKYSASSVSELIGKRDALSGSLFDSDALKDRLGELERLIAAGRKDLDTVCGALRESRKAAAGPFAEAVTSGLRSLELERAVFEVKLSEAEASPSGADEAAFMFSASGGKTVDVAKCASGGELSRLMLCLKALMAGYTQMPTLIFDEIDTGVSGSAADKMGQMICSMGRNMQVFAITHLPQVAAKGDAHYVVEKEFFMDKATTSIRQVEGRERVMEIARMLSGSHVSAAAIENAKSLLSDQGD